MTEVIAGQADETIERTPEPATPELSGPKTTKQQIRDAFKEVSERQAKAAEPQKAADKPKEKPASEKAPEAKAADERPRGEHGHFAPKDKPAAEAPKEATAAVPEIPAAQTMEAPAVAASKPAAGPPPSWSQEAKSHWGSIPPAIHQAIAKREQEVSDGFKAKEAELNRYRPIEQALAPHRQAFQRAGLGSDAEAINRLLYWENYLRTDPQRGIRDLARNYGVNLSPPAQPQGQTEGQDQTQTEPPAYLRQLFDHVGSVDQRLNSVMSRFEAENNARVAQEIAAFSKDKPYFERVKASMGMLMKAASDANQPIDLNEAYQRATWADPEIRAEILAEQNAAAERERQAAAAKAAKEAEEKRKADEAKRAAEAEAKRKASVSPKGSTPAGKAANTARKPHSHSVRDSILAARNDIEGRV